MIQLPIKALPRGSVKQLSVYQNEINSIASYASRVARAKTSWEAHSRKGNPTFDAVKRTLTKMCSGARRCIYCEDSAADEVEHIWPKAIYPKRTFRWSNYLYACGPCNGPKNSKFAVFQNGSDTVTEVARRRGAPVSPPIKGMPVLIDPRREDPAVYITLDLRDTFWFIPIARQGTREYERAEYTIRVLRLNVRDYLPQARQQAYKDYKAHLVQYWKLREGGAPMRRLKQLSKDVHRRQHPTVWMEMKRQHHLIPELQMLFKRVPEALTW